MWAKLRFIINMSTSQPKPPNAFVSYSWDDEAHKTWVRDLSTRLRGDGVNVTLDQWATAPGDQLPQFMESAVRENDYVLIVCMPLYKEKSDKRLGGVGYEGGHHDRRGFHHPEPQEVHSHPPEE